jgi:hypothetical protein
MEDLMLFDPAVMYSPPPQSVRVTAEMMEHYKLLAHAHRTEAYAHWVRTAWRGLKRLGCWFRRPSVDVALRGGCD